MKDRLRDLVASGLCRLLRARFAPNQKPSDLGSCRAILVLKLDALGDFVLMTPFLRELRRAAPQAFISLVTLRTAQSLASTCPYVDEFAELPLDQRPRRCGSLQLMGRYSRFLRTSLSRRSYDLAIIPRTGPDNHHARLLAYLSGARERVGFASARTPIPSHAALTHTLPDPALHEVEANLSLLCDLGVSVQSNKLELQCPEEAQRQLASLVTSEGLDLNEPFVALGVGASLAHKRWPAEHYTQLADWFVRTKGWKAVILGDDQDRAAFPAPAPGVLVLAGRLSPNQSFALLHRASLFVGNDSGAMHLAAAAGCPSIVVLPKSPDHRDSTDPNAFFRFAPFGVPYATVFPDPGRPDDVAHVSFAKTRSTVEQFWETTGHGRRNASALRP